MKPLAARIAVGMVCLFVGHVAQAQATRTWVSGVGDDANPCSRTAPCKTFAGAISKTAAGGEINALDSGGFGAVTITKSITISAEGVTAGVLASGTNGVIVNAGANDFVVLRGLDIEGAGTGLNGIRFLSAGAVFVENCTINNFSQRGIDYLPASNSQLHVKNTVIRNNATGGIIATGSASALANVFLDGVQLNRNFFGVRMQDFTRVAVSNSAAVGNANNGFWAFASGNATSMTIQNSVAAQNGVSGVRAEGSATVVRISDVTVTDNLIGLLTGSGGSIQSFGNNRNAGNGTNNAPAGTIPQQ